MHQPITKVVWHISWLPKIVENWFYIQNLRMDLSYQEKSVTWFKCYNNSSDTGEFMRFFKHPDILLIKSGKYEWADCDSQMFKLKEGGVGIRVFVQTTAEFSSIEWDGGTPHSWPNSNLPHKGKRLYWIYFCILNNKKRFKRP